MTVRTCLKRAWREPFVVGHVPGVIGVVESDFSWWSGLSLTVSGQRTKPQGLLRRRVQLPGVGTNVEARLKGLLLADTRLVVDGLEYPIAPPVPAALRVLAGLPHLVLLLAPILFSLPVAVIVLNANIVVLRSPWPLRHKIALVAASTAAGFAVAAGFGAVFGPALRF